jgi:hypothetical protein
VRHPLRLLSLAFMLLLAAPAGSQPKSERAAAPPQPVVEASGVLLSPDPQFQRPRSREEDRFRIEQERRMARERNKERQAALKKDTDKLLELATELKEYVDKTDENMLSLDVIKKAEEIEKLSKSVKEKMKADEYYPPIGSERR